MNLKELFFRHLAQTSDAPLAIEVSRAEGIYIYTPEGKRLTDLISGVSVSNTGHGHPAIIKAVQEQVEKYMHLMVYGEMIQSPQVLLAHRLAQLLPPPLESVYFVNSGSEAIEGAIKLSKKYTGRKELISCFRAYHGSTIGSMSLMGDDSFRRAFEPLMPDCKRIRHGNADDLQQITAQTAAVVIEIVQGEAGVRSADRAYWQQLRQRCSSTGTLLVFDEIQTAFCRTGTFFAFEQTGVMPDVLVLAKALGGGMPLGAFIASTEAMQTLTHHPVLGHITTFGGHPVCCAASLAALDVMENEDLLESVTEKSALFRQSLSALPQVKAFRQQGLLIALDFDDPAFNFRVIQKALENGLLTDWFLFCDTALRIAPPLTITLEQIKEVCHTLTVVIEETGKPKWNGNKI
jgi:acetylornithine/succinyldiaminopimelate/putrescine aminotransferase